MDKLIGYEKQVFQDDDDNTVVEYYNIPDTNWIRIREIALLLSDSGIGPKVYNVDEINRAITTETIVIFGQEPDEEDFPHDETVEKIKSVVDKFHDLGLVHGDLGFSNIGYRLVDDDWKPVIIDYDTIHYKNDYDPAFLEWIQERFDMDSYEDYLEYEYEYSGWIY